LSSVDINAVPEDITDPSHCSVFDYTANIASMTVTAGASGTAVATVCGSTTSYSLVDGEKVHNNLGRVTSTVFDFGAEQAGEAITVNLANGDGRRITDTLILDSNGQHTLDHHKIEFGPTSNVDFGISWWQVARFQSVKFNSAGTYKLCFCDSVRAGRPCTDKSDFVVEVGTIHASGVSCLLDDNKFRAKACIEGYTYTGLSETSHGALTCHDEPITLSFPRVLDDITVAEMQTMESTTVAQMTTFCLYGPEENTRGLPLCQVVANFQSSV